MLAQRDKYLSGLQDTNICQFYNVGSKRQIFVRFTVLALRHKYFQVYNVDLRNKYFSGLQCWLLGLTL